MDKTNIEQFIKGLETEIKETKKDLDLTESLTRLKEVARVYQGEDRVVSTEEISFNVKNRPLEHKIMTGWKALDDILSGFRYKQLVIISAPTKNGKTSFCMDLTSRLKEYNPLWFPFEEGMEELISKYLDRNEEPPHAYAPSLMIQDTSLLWLEKKIIEGIAKYDAKVVFIDHLHFIVPFASERYDLRIGDTMRKVKALAKKWNIVIFLIAHIKKARMDEHPTLEDLRDSSFVAQEADTVIMLWRETKKEKGQVIITDNVNISVQANRKTGKTGNVKMQYQNGKFLEINWKSEREQQAEVEEDAVRKFMGI